MSNNIFQVVTINYPILKIRPPRVCDISPFVAATVYNFVGLEGSEIEHTLRSGEFWDNAAGGRVLTAVTDKAAAKA